VAFSVLSPEELFSRRLRAQGDSSGPALPSQVRVRVEEEPGPSRPQGPSLPGLVHYSDDEDTQDTPPVEAQRRPKVVRTDRALTALKPSVLKNRKAPPSKPQGPPPQPIVSKPQGPAPTNAVDDAYKQFLDELSGLGAI